MQAIKESGLSYSAKISHDSDMPLFGDSMMFDVCPGLRVSLKMMNSMIESNYIVNNNGKLNFTNAGIEHMMKDHDKFLECVKKNYPNITGPFRNLVCQLLEDSKKIRPGNDTVANFEKSNMLMSYCDNDGDNNNVVNELGFIKFRSDPEPDFDKH